MEIDKTTTATKPTSVLFGEFLGYSVTQDGLHWKHTSNNVAFPFGIFHYTTYDELIGVLSRFKSLKILRPEYDAETSIKYCDLCSEADLQLTRANIEGLTEALMVAVNWFNDKFTEKRKDIILENELAVRNKIIATFMGATLEEREFHKSIPEPVAIFLPIKEGQPEQIIPIRGLRYDKDWNLFMLAYIKFRSLTGMPVEYNQYLKSCEDWVTRGRLIEAFHALAMAIDWYVSPTKRPTYKTHDAR